MTKIYLVKVKLWDGNDNYHEVNFKAFTNRKKAKIYCEYKNLQVKLGTSTLCQQIYSDIEFVVEELHISQTDWSEELNELQIKDLPY